MEGSSSTSTDAQPLLPSHISVQITEISPVSDAAAAPTPLTQANGVANDDLTSQGARIRSSNLHEAMYRATLEGDCVAVQRLLREDLNLGRDEITEEGDTALPLAVSMNHHKIMRKLLQILSADELETLNDADGYTTIASLMIRKNPTIATAHDRDNNTPLQTTEISPVSDAAAAPLPLTHTNEITIHHLAMYRATLEGDYVSIQRLLREHPNLGRDEIAVKGVRALHLAVSMNHHKIVQKLLERVSGDELETLKDGDGYTACCHAAISGSLEIAGLLITKNPTIATSRDRDNKTPLQKAALRGNTKMVLFFMEYTGIEHLTTDEWFDLLLVTIRGRMYGAALKILEIDEQLAIMTKGEGTPFHVLAREKSFNVTYGWRAKKHKGIMQLDMRLLAQKLWTCIQSLRDVASVLELMKNPSILHIAAEVGNVELITMVTHTYPDLVWHTNTQGYTLFHIAVKHRQACLFMLINQIGTRKDFIATSEVENENNILHLAAELGPVEVYNTPMPPFRMRWEMLWFEKVKAIVPPECLQMKNKDGHTPRKLFMKEHLSLLKESNTWMRATSDSCMLIATLLFGLVFASTFAVPGGYNQNTGFPIFFKTFRLQIFSILEAVAMSSAGLSIIMFWHIMIICNNDKIFTVPLNTSLFTGAHLGLFMAVLCVDLAFMTAYFLVYTHLFVSVFYILMTCLSLLYFVTIHGYVISRYCRPGSLFQKNGHSLFKRHPATACRMGRINECL